MRFDLKVPCKHCPFRTDGPAIRFSGIERAQGVGARAYAYGWPCHESADYNDTDDEDSGFVFGGNTQHCAGATILFLRNGHGNIPFKLLSEAERNRVRDTVNMQAPVFDTYDAYIEANRRGNRG